MMKKSKDRDAESRHFREKEGKPPKKRVRFLLPTTSSADSDTEASLPVRKDLPTAQEFLMRPGLAPTHQQKCRSIWSLLSVVAAAGRPDIEECVIRHVLKSTDHTISRMLLLMLQDGILQRKGQGSVKDPFQWRVTARSMFLPHYAKEDLEAEVESSCQTEEHTDSPKHSYGLRKRRLSNTYD